MAEEPEIARAERRELKQKQAAEKTNKSGSGGAKRGDGTDDDDDDLLINPNHVTKKLNISDLSAPRELTRRERYVPVSHTPALFVLTIHHFFMFLCVGNRRRRRRPRSVIGR